MSIPAWLRGKNATRAPSSRDDTDAIPRTSSPACAFCAALDRELGGAMRVDLAAIEREHGECSCFNRGAW